MKNKTVTLKFDKFCAEYRAEAVLSEDGLEVYDLDDRGERFGGDDYDYFEWEEILQWSKYNPVSGSPYLKLSIPLLAIGRAKGWVR